MSVLPSASIPAGWYPDPAGSFQQRWWNGSAWTNDFAQYRPTLIHSAPVVESIASQQAQLAESSAAYTAAHAAASQSSGAQAATGTTQASTGSTQTMLRDVVSPHSNNAFTTFSLPAEDQAPSTSVAQPNAGNATLIAVNPVGSRPVTVAHSTFGEEYMPFGAPPEVQWGPRDAPLGRYTASAWILSGLPLALVGLAFVLASYLPATYTTFVQAILVVGFVAASVGLAVGDRVSLSRHGHERTASPALAVLTPLVYLTVRSILVSRETGRGSFGPLAVLLGVLVAIGATILIVDGLGALLVTAVAPY